MSDWNVYRHDSCHGPLTIRSNSLTAEPTGDGWWAVYRRQGGRYCNAVIGLRREPVNVDQLVSADRRNGENIDQFESRIIEQLSLKHHHDPSLPSPSYCVESPFPLPTT